MISATAKKGGRGLDESITGVHNGQTLLIGAVTRAPFVSDGNFFIKEATGSHP